ncbi:hypothetical protein POPTR_003G055501v4 [Populus trichocarpa]|uniref:C2 domain-containing protein n=1 Tax=Populus trichocarpa TaxID=3694 RepID=A0A3N7EPH3_POPTR|nr:hypothetical protein POPTR_003G055501v4 [Populus trichocarpa]
MLVGYTKGRDGTLTEAFRTEVVLNSLNPTWIAKHTITFQFEVVQTLVFHAYDVGTQFHNIDVKYLCSSHQFFVTPGPSSSLVEEARSSLTATSKNLGSNSTSMSTCCNNLNDVSTTVASNDIKQDRLPDDCIVAALTDSPSPYDDF